MLRNALLPAAACTLTLIALGAAAGDRSHRPVRVSAQLVPTEEVPVLSSNGSGRFRATVDRANQTISYEVSYQGLDAEVTQAHIHIGSRRTNGGISVFLCLNPALVTTPPPGPTPPLCSGQAGTVTGTLTPANVIGPNAQGVAPTAGDVNEFDELVELLLEGFTYANVHSARFPAGEVRGQVQVDRHRH